MSLHILNRDERKTKSIKTLPKLWKERLAIVKHFNVFRRKCYNEVNEDKLEKFESKFDEGMFLGYTYQSKWYIFFTKRKQ